MVTAEVQVRSGTEADETWLFELFRQTMQPYIAAAWGWEELLQREGFTTSLPAREFQILLRDDVPVGSFHLTSDSGALTLNMILVEPRWQRQGYGLTMMKIIQQRARQAGLPLQLRVQKTNPAVKFHERCGFEAVSGDEHSLEMRWLPD